MNTIKCPKCQHENSQTITFCEKCKTALNATIDLDKVDSDVSKLMKVSEAMSDKKIPDDTVRLRDESLPKTPDEWKEALQAHKVEQAKPTEAADSATTPPPSAAQEKPEKPSDTPLPTVNVNEASAKPKDASIGSNSEETVEKTMEVLPDRVITDSTALIRDEALPKTDEEWKDALLRHKVEEEPKAEIKVEVPENPTDALPPMEDEDSEQNIGAVRFRGDLLLKHQDSDFEFVIENSKLTEVVVGRLDRATGFSPTIDLTEHGGKAKGVSRRHATISARGDLLFITDHNSVNGTFLNGQRLVPEQARVLRDTDVLRIGRVDLLVNFKSPKKD